MSNSSSRVLFILLTCSPIEFLIYQIKNILHFNPGCIICINFSPELIPYKSIVKSISDNVIVNENCDDVLIKPHSNGKGYHEAWMKCYRHCNDLIFTHVCFISSNELFFRKGSISHIEKYQNVSYKHENSNIKIGEFGKDYTNGIKNILFGSLNLDFCTVGQWEGSFFTRENFHIMYEILSEKLNFDYGQSCEEVLIPSLFLTIYHKKYLGYNTHITKVLYDVGTEAPLDYLDEKNIYSVKRVSYNMNSKLFKAIDKITEEEINSIKASIDESITQ